MSKQSSLSRRAFMYTGAASLGDILLLTSCLSKAVKSPHVGSNKDLEALIPTLMERHSVPGVSIAQISNANISWAEGFGVKSTANKDQVNTETIFEAASLSKPVFASLVLKLCADKVMSLDESLADFFRYPDLQNEPQINLITPGIVLSHQTGLQNWRRGTEPLKVQFKPGTGFSYSGEAYVRLQRAVEKKTGKSLTDLAQAYLFDPLKMTESSYVWRSDFEKLAAEGHNPEGKVVRTRLWKYSPDSPQAMKLPPGVDIPLFAIPNAAASLYSTPTDYAKLMIELMKPGGGAAIKLSEQSVKVMFTPVAKLNASISWGLGWGISDVADMTTFWQWGNNDVYQGFAFGSRKQKSGLVIMTNSQNGLKLCREVVSKVIGVEHPAFSWPMVLK